LYPIVPFELYTWSRLIDSPDMPLWVKPGSLATINALDQLRKEPELEWSFLSPSAELNPGHRTGKFRLGNDQLLVDATGQSKISVQDYAVAMIDELERPDPCSAALYGRVLKASSDEVRINREAGGLIFENRDIRAMVKSR